MFETLAENLQKVIFANHSMVLAGPGIQNWILFGSFFRHVFELPFAMFLGSHFDDFGLPLGLQWEPLLGPKLDLLGVIFRTRFWDRLGSDFGRGRRQGRSLSKPAGSARTW